MLATLPAGSVDLVLTDPPYGCTANPWDVPFDLPAFWKECARVCNPNGSAVVVFCDMRLAATLIASNPKAFRFDLVWSKNQASGWMSVKKRPMRAHEHILVFASGPDVPVTYFPEKTKGEPKSVKTGKGKTNTYRRDFRPDYVNLTGDRFPRSVVSIKCVHNSSAEKKAGGKHSSQKPVALLAYLVRSFSLPGSCVCDPFSGSGTTGVASLSEGRSFVGSELDAFHFGNATKRLLAVIPGLPAPAVLPAAV